MSKCKILLFFFFFCLVPLKTDQNKQLTYVFFYIFLAQTFNNGNEKYKIDGLSMQSPKKCFNFQFWPFHHSCTLTNIYDNQNIGNVIQLGNCWVSQCESTIIFRQYFHIFFVFLLCKIKIISIRICK